jgi:hypothetical protein
MYPYYHQVTGLTDDDIAGIRALYGNVAATPPPVVPVVPPVTPPPVTPPPAPPVQPPVNPPPVQPPVSTPPAGGGSDTTAPTLQIATPGASIVSTTAASIAIAGSASDNVAVASVKWSTSYGDGGTASGTTSWSASVPLLTGTNSIIVRAYDAAGNSAWRSITVVRR